MRGVAPLKEPRILRDWNVERQRYENCYDRFEVKWRDKDHIVATEDVYSKEER